ncbi:hypothetical protein BCR34DRAFT_599762 [Clohesyomyces aquaticus]|uniref:Uncharacterized protein n=1 Tax=Clohesyomyces aquaticus TaxID=1231657 RepID=A0A1Y1ZTK7_9PLEO|nr:hypothetical protein BCR34DRAFT_599762 [Clohesyomyces aquaticus]
MVEFQPDARKKFEAYHNSLLQRGEPRNRFQRYCEVEQQHSERYIVSIKKEAILQGCDFGSLEEYTRDGWVQKILKTKYTNHRNSWVRDTRKGGAALRRRQFWSFKVWQTRDIKVDIVDRVKLKVRHKFSSLDTIEESEQEAIYQMPHRRAVPQKKTSITPEIEVENDEATIQYLIGLIQRAYPEMQQATRENTFPPLSVVDCTQPFPSQNQYQLQEYTETGEMNTLLEKLENTLLEPLKHSLPPPSPEVDFHDPLQPTSNENQPPVKSREADSIEGPIEGHWKAKCIHEEARPATSGGGWAYQPYGASWLSTPSAPTLPEISVDITFDFDWDQVAATPTDSTSPRASVTEREQFYSGYFVRGAWFLVFPVGEELMIIEFKIAVIGFHIATMTDSENPSVHMADPARSRSLTVIRAELAQCNTSNSLDLLKIIQSGHVRLKNGAVIADAKTQFGRAEYDTPTISRREDF